MFRKLDVIVAGAGISGLSAARLLADQGKRVLVVEKRRNIGGHCYDYFNDYGILVQPYGPHIFHTSLNDVWSFLSRFTEWNHYQHKVGGFIDGKTVPIPFNLNTLEKVFPRMTAARTEEKLLNTFSLGSRVPILTLKESGDKDLHQLADFVYENVFLNYTLKQWGGMRPEDLDPSVSARVPVVVSRDDRYFTDTYQGIPLKGVSRMMKSMVDHPNIHVLLNTDVSDLVRVSRSGIEMDGHSFKGKYIHTGPIDGLFEYRLGELPYRSLRLEFESFPCNGTYQSSGVVNYPNNYDFTRITEFKNFQRNPVLGHTTICREYPEDYRRGINHPFYVVNNEDNQKLYRRYRSLSNNIPNLFCLGRLGEYRYYDMDKAVLAAISLVSKL